MTGSAFRRIAAVAALLAGAPPVPAQEPTVQEAREPTVEEVVARHVEARGGARRWAEVDTLELRGLYASFSDQEPFTLVRRRGDLFRLDFKLLGGEAVRAKDAEGAWWQHPLLQPQPGRAAEPYESQIEREARFGPLLIDPAEKGVSVELVGASEIEGIPVIELSVTLPGERQERWFLDAETHLEVAVDSEVSDHTQSLQPMRQRAFYDDFREVEGLVIPFRLDYEFGHRLESMTVEEVVVDGELDDARFRLPVSEGG